MDTTCILFISAGLAAAAGVFGWTCRGVRRRAAGLGAQRFTRAFDAMPMAAALLRRGDRRIVAVNRRFETMFGYAREELLGHSAAELALWIHEDDQVRLVGQVLEGRAIQGLQVPLHRKDGSRGWMELSGDLFAQDGEDFALVAAVDISEGKAAELALERSERFLKEAQAAGRVGCFSMDITLGIWEGSGSFDTLFGIGPDYPRDVQGWLDLVAPDYREVHRRNLLALIQGQGPLSLEFRILRRSDGEERWILCQGSLERDDQGQTTRLIGTMLDITERKQGEARIERLNQELEDRVQLRTAELEAANQELEAFSYSVSHDLRAPLQASQGYATTLLEGHGEELDPAGRKCLSGILASSRRMAELIDDLMALSHASHHELVRQDLDLSALCGKVAASLAAIRPGPAVDLEIQPGMRVHADPGLLQVVLENLVGNAWKFTSRQAERRIRVGEHRSLAGERVFYVQDNGAGFSMEQAGRLFKAFQRLHARSEYEGTGIGLATVARIVGRHGGRIWADSEPGQGATFSFTLPERTPK